MSEDKEQERLLRLRQKINARRPKFVRQESWRYNRLKSNWRRPKGIDNKMKKKKKGYPKMAGVGYRGPKAVRGIHPSGYETKHVANTSDLDDIDPETEAIIIQGTVGQRKRQRIVEQAEELKIKIINPPVEAVEIGEILDEVELEEEYELLEEDFEFEDDEFDFEDEELDLEDLDLDELEESEMDSEEESSE